MSFNGRKIMAFIKFFRRADENKTIQLFKEGSHNQVSLPQHLFDDIYTQMDVDEEYKPKSKNENLIIVAVQFGFLLLFSCAFPIAPLFALVNNLIEVRADAKRMLTSHHRPVTLRAKDIGLWQKIIEFVVHLSIIVNGTIIAFGSDWFNKNILDGLSPDQKLVYRLLSIIAFEHVIILVWWLIIYIIPPECNEIKVIQQREEYLDMLENGEIVENNVEDPSELDIKDMFGN
jgi:hypothetical protein